MSTGDFKNGTNLTGGIVSQSVLGTDAAKLTLTIDGANVTEVPAGKYLKIAKVVVANTSASAVTVSYGATKSGGTLGVDGTLQGKTVPLGAAGSATATADLTELANMFLGPGDYLAAWASAGTSVTQTTSATVSS